jgi:osmotically-inducible protein OsmY
MEQPQQHEPTSSDFDSQADAATSRSPGGGRQVEQEPARGHRRGDSPSPRADADIRSDLDARLANADDYDPNLVELLVSDGIVVMLGEVADYETKRHLEDLSAAVPGVREIHDQLQVRGETASQTSEGLRVEAPRTKR